MKSTRVLIHLLFKAYCQLWSFMRQLKARTENIRLCTAKDCGYWWAVALCESNQCRNLIAVIGWFPPAKMWAVLLQIKTDIWKIYLNMVKMVSGCKICCYEIFSAFPKRFIVFPICKRFQYESTWFWHCWGITEMLFVEQPLISSFLCHNSATTCRMDSNKTSITKLQLADLYGPSVCRVIRFWCYF